MSAKSFCIYATVVIGLLLAAGCKPSREKAGQSAEVGMASPAEIAALKEVMTRGMQEVALDSLGTAQAGRQCVVIAHTSGERNRADSAPPPLGMVRRIGQAVAYKGEIVDVSPAGVKIRAPYPTSGQYKTIDVPRADIESIHLPKLTLE